ncbi:HD-GYP domain-containing protein [Bacillus massilinigeriensis]|uniref:HD-GYP domain-containing protein n=1 Tax=Bacillus mediterraneensis TaxID=1805474 RepID=UPI0009F28632|nr:HD-GYP domain-containing protein [Bacillus mediterraneensis]
MRVSIEELHIGCILSEDVYSKTNRPIVVGQTVLTEELIAVLKSFMIKEVEVEKTLVSGLPFLPSKVLAPVQETEPQEKGEEQLNFFDTFLSTKVLFEKEFSSWQSGFPVDIFVIRNLLLPLMDMIDKESSNLFRLHHLTTNEDYLYHHSLATGLISAYIAKKLGYNKGDIIQVALAGCLADCGMAKINGRILKKDKTLSGGEFEEVKKHPTYSYQMVKNSTLLKENARIAIIQHHERLDGSGYPFGEKDARIHEMAKIIAVADVFHAMTSERVFQSKMSPFKVIETIDEDYFGKFDVRAVNALKSIFMNYSVGSIIKLSDGQQAEIMFVDDRHPARPMVKLLKTNEIISLTKNRHLYIEEILG